jgi:drug/metabolite transporter (DMT)-like permease
MASVMVIARHYQDIAILPAACLASLLSGLIAIPFASPLFIGGANLVYLILFGLVNSAIGIVLFTQGSRLLPAIETGLIGSLDAPLAPIWVWLAFGETPSRATILGGVIVFGAVFVHIVISARGAESGYPQPAPAAAKPDLTPTLPL